MQLALAKLLNVRHDICQFIYTTGVFEAKILPKKARKSRQIYKFTTKQRKCFQMTNSRQKHVNALK